MMGESVNPNTLGTVDVSALRLIFDPDYYQRAAEKRSISIGNPLEHFLSIGWRLGLNPCALFDVGYYLEQSRAAADSSLNPLIHYLLNAQKGYGFSPWFDVPWYVKKNPAAARDPLQHFLMRTAGAFHTAHPNFDPAAYARQHPKAAEHARGILSYFLEFDGQPHAPHASTQEPLTIRKVSPPKKQSSDSLSPSMAQGPNFDPNWSERLSVLRALRELDLSASPAVPAHILAEASRILSRSIRAPSVSVIMATWNRRDTICGAIDSILAQTLLPLEIIISDDGSDDDTIALIRDLYPDHLSSGLLKILSNPHRGVCAARNAGLVASSGDIITYLDSDNHWRPEYLLLVASAFAECDELGTLYTALRSVNRGTNEIRHRATEYDRKRLLSGNFIDLNVFAHRRMLFDTCGGFDTNLTRLVDWDLILRYTRLHTPAYLPFCGVDYHLDAVGLKNITFTEGLEKNRQRILRKHFQERVRHGLEELRVAYFVYDFPALSQTFVLNELRWLVQKGIDVKVFYAVDPDQAATLDFPVDAQRVSSAEHFADALVQTRRNICHSHFAFPGVTKFVMPACEIAEINYTFMPHAVDIFLHTNRVRNRLADIVGNERCLKAFVYGDFHREFLESHGVRPEKICYNFQAVRTEDFAVSSLELKRFRREHPTAIVIARFIEKKGIDHLINALSRLRDLPLTTKIYGYGPLRGPLEEQVRRLGLRNVEFPGLLEDRDALQRAYQDADFLIAPCVEAKNGDVDGFPTVILEAIAAGLPVVTTSVSAIPDYLRDGIEAVIATPADAGSLADKIRHLLSIGDEEREAMVRNAQRFLRNRVGVDRTMRQLLDVWTGYQVALFLVTFNNEKYDDQPSTLEILRRALERTTTPFTLTIVDNNSEPAFLKALRSMAGRYGNVRHIEKSRNVFCGPASNVALRQGTSEFAIYLCSKEGFIAKHGWERPLIERMRDETDVAMAGYKTHLPKYARGSELRTHPKFGSFRNQQFADTHPNRRFEHIQGGVYILRRNTLEEYGFFNPRLPQDLMDVEFSYFLESCGARLEVIPEISSISNKTLPRVTSIIDENTSVAHPLSAATTQWVDRPRRAHFRLCNLCAAELAPDHLDVCRGCGSTPFGRSVGKLIAHNARTHRNELCALASSDEGLLAFLRDRLFKTVTIDPRQAKAVDALADLCRTASVTIVDLDEFPRELAASLPTQIVQSLPDDARLILGGRHLAEVESIAKRSPRPLEMERRAMSGSYLSLDWRPIAIYRCEGHST